MPLDTVFRAETPEGIALTLRPAGFAPRAQAYLLDLLIRLGLLIGVSMAASVAAAMGEAFVLISVFLLEWFYPVVFELAMGATPGKRALGLQVVMDTGLPVTPTASLIRNLLRAADFLPALYAAGIVAMLSRTDFRRLGDIAAGTVVVHSDPVSLHGKVPETAPRAAARTLSQREQAAIVAWAARAGRLTPARFDELALIAQAVAPADEAQPRLTPTQRLLGVAQAILGRAQDKT
jgi:uncharacterized RDD family membrane protein YckC